MRLAIASDIHGSAYWCEKLLAAIERKAPDRVILLGDLLYHGPRNDLPRGYDPKRVAEMLNGWANKIVAVRGNCDAEVDQMLLSFPCMADYSVIVDSSTPGATGSTRELFATHGHVYGPGLHGSVDRIPHLAPGSALLYGHTHVKVHKITGDIEIFNPGSVSIPKDGSNSFGMYENGTFSSVVL